MKILPLPLNIIVERIKPEETNEFGIMIPTKEESLKAVVVAVYEGCEGLKVGDKIIYAKFAGDPIPPSMMEGRDCLMMEFTQENVLATYE